MSLRRLAVVLIALLLLGEAAVALWRHLPIEPSTAPVFSLPPAAANFGKLPSLAPAVEMYGADRGGEWNTTAPDGSRLTVFYFEWDQGTSWLWRPAAGRHAGGPLPHLRPLSSAFAPCSCFAPDCS